MEARLQHLRYTKVEIFKTMESPSIAIEATIGSIAGFYSGYQSRHLNFFLLSK